jgi:hypothetical protein
MYFSIPGSSKECVTDECERTDQTKGGMMAGFTEIYLTFRRLFSALVFHGSDHLAIRAATVYTKPRSRALDDMDGRNQDTGPQLNGES